MKVPDLSSNLEMDAPHKGGFLTDGRSNLGKQLLSVISYTISYHIID